MSISLRLYTDFVCPFCFIAEASTVPRLLADYDLTLDWRGFELHPGTPRGGLPLTALFPGAHLPSLAELERRYLVYVLETMNGNRSRAAEVMGIDRRTLYRMAERYGIELDGE